MKLFIWFLVAAAPGLELPDELPAEFDQPAAVAAIKDFAEANDLHSAGDRYGKFADELEYMRMTYRDLAEAPPWRDVARLPPMAVIDANISFADDYISRCGGTDWSDDIKWAEAATYHREAWNKMASARYRLDDENCQLIRWGRRSLTELRDMIGDEAYYSGNWPPPVPLEYFRSID